jgi:RHO1 GDP-GTP exchange protein 1/2
MKPVDMLGWRKAIQNSNRVFAVKYLSNDTFVIPSIAEGANPLTGNQDRQFTGKVMCSVPFSQSFHILYRR